MLTLRSIVGFCAVLWIACSAGIAQTLSIQISGNGSIVRKVYGPNGWEIDLHGQGALSVTFTLTATSGSNPINYVKVESEKCGSNCNSNALLVIEEDGGTIPSIQRILKSGASDAEVWIQRVEISGYIGDQSDPTLYPIEADIVSRIIADGGVYADITAGPRTSVGPRQLWRSHPPAVPSAVPSPRCMGTLAT